MKSRYRWPILLLGLIVGITASVTGLCMVQVPFRKLILHEGRILGPPVPALVTLDGTEQKDILVFKEYSTSDSEKEGRLVLWSSRTDIFAGRHVALIFLRQATIGSPVASSVDDYRLYFGQYLFQSESGGIMLSWADGLKGLDFDPKLSESNGVIVFLTPLIGKQRVGKVTVTIAEH